MNKDGKPIFTLNKRVVNRQHTTVENAVNTKADFEQNYMIM